MFLTNLREWIFVWILHTVGQRRIDIFDTQKLERLEDHLAGLREAKAAVVREALADQYVTVEAREVLDADNPDAPEGARIDIEELPFCDVTDDLRIRIALQAEHRSRPRLDLSFKRAAGDVRLLARLHQTVHDELILERTVLHATAAGVPAMETHEEILGEYAFKLRALEDVCRHGVVDIQQRGRHS